MIRPANRCSSLPIFVICHQTMIYWPFVILCLVAILAIIIARSIRVSGQGWGVWLCYQVAKAHAFIFARWMARNPCTIPEHGAAIIVSNHTSPVDPSLLWIRHFSGFRKKQLRVIGFMMAREYYDRRDIVGWACRTMQAIPVERAGRDMGPVKNALVRLEEGKLLGLFPEGRINDQTPDERLLAGGTGVAWLALKSRVPVLPVFIHNAPRGRTMVSSFFVCSRTSLTYGKPVDLSEWYDRKLTRNTLAEATDRIMESLAALGQLAHTPVAAAVNSENG